EREAVVELADPPRDLVVGRQGVLRARPRVAVLEAQPGADPLRRRIVELGTLVEQVAELAGDPVDRRWWWWLRRLLRHAPRSVPPGPARAVRVLRDDARGAQIRDAVAEAELLQHLVGVGADRRGRRARRRGRPAEARGMAGLTDAARDRVHVLDEETDGPRVRIVDELGRRQHDTAR